MTVDVRADERGHRLAVLGAVALIVTCQLAGAALLDAHFLGAKDRTRNPNYRRLWPEYVLSAPPKADGETLVLLIGNSQGYGPEIPERMIYPTLLAKELTERAGKPVRVENWSVQSGNAPDFALLSAFAHRIRPDVTLLMTSPRNFSEKFRIQKGEHMGLDFGLPDIRRLAGYADVRANLSESFRDFYLDTNELLDASLGRFMPLWRYRDLTRVLPNRIPELMPFSKGAEQQHWLFENPEQPRWKRQHVQRLPVPLVSWDLVEESAHALGTIPGRRIFARMPSHSMTNTDFPSFVKRAGVYFEAEGAEVWDLRQLIDDDGFITVSHLNERGHAALAHALAERLGP
jgi:hypothetical protein